MLGPIASLASGNTLFTASASTCEMPDSRYINDGFQVLLELGAVEAV